MLDSAYTLATLRRLGNEQSVLCRDLDGFFRHVWSVHPFGDVSGTLGEPLTGPLVVERLAERHTFVQARAGRFRFLRRFFPVNFMLAQAALYVHLRRLIRSEKIDLIRVGDPLYLGLLGLALAKGAKIPLVIRVNANNERVRQTTGLPMFPRLLRSSERERKIERFVFPRSDLVVAPNQDNVDYAVASGACADRVAIFRYGNLLSPAHLVDPRERGTDESLFRALGVQPGRYLLCVSRLKDSKFPDDAIRVLAGVRSRDYDVKLVLAGEGPMRSELETLAGELGVAAEVVFAGNLQQAALQQLYAHAATVISPLTGRALSEAALGGAPIVAYDLDWQADLVETGVTGELVPFRQTEAMADAAARFLAGPAYARAMGAAIRRRALDILDPAKLNAHERETYAKLLQRSAS